MPSNKYPAVRSRRTAAIFLAGLAILLCFGLSAVLKAPAANRALPPLIIRIDDIQDYAFREGQLFLLDESAADRFPVSLAVIPKELGEDKEILAAVAAAMASGAEITAHGWEHEDLATFSLEDQTVRLTRARARTREVLGRDTTILVPPMFSFNKDTFTAMQAAGYTIISAFHNLCEPGLISQVLSLPGTVSLSDLADNTTWEMKNAESIKTAISLSVQKYGFAILVTHPQEFLVEGKLDQALAERFVALINTLKESYEFTTLEKLGAKLGRKYSAQ